MAKMSLYFFIAAFVTLGLATALYIWHAASRRQDVGRYASIASTSGLAFLTLSLLARWVAAGHAPYSNQYEFATSFVWGIGAVYLYLENQYRLRLLGAFVWPIALALLAYAALLPNEIQPLVPALQNNTLLTLHVGAAVVAYGCFTVAFGAAVMYLWQRRGQVSWLPPKEVLDDVAFKAVILGFPMQALVLILGSMWGNVAWGSYWNWDPKETATLLTWLVYGVYLHGRAVRGWRGTPAAVVLLVGFAATLFTFFGNYFLGGLHSYGGF